MAEWDLEAMNLPKNSAIYIARHVGAYLALACSLMLAKVITTS